MFEINLIPNVKFEMVKAQKSRNIIALFCVFIGIAIAVVLLVLGGIKAGQDITIGAKKSQITTSAQVIDSFSNLDSFLTVQSQLNSLSEISDSRKLLSRIFGIIWVFAPTNGDVVKYSDVNINFEESTISFEAQADAKNAAYLDNDYVVVEAFEKSIDYLTYDYGHYVDAEGNDIPSVCIVETDIDGNSATDGEKMVAYWSKNVNGCNPATNVDEEGKILHEEALIKEEDVRAAVDAGDYVTIYRTPKFAEWYKNSNMGEDGAISGVEHFESQCLKYAYFDGKWNSSNDCKLAPNGIQVSSKSRAVSSEDGSSVVVFHATIGVDPAIFLAKNKHMIAIGPSFRVVTDSYLSNSQLFAPKASEVSGDNMDNSGDIE